MLRQNSDNNSTSKKILDNVVVPGSVGALSGQIALLVGFKEGPFGGTVAMLTIQALTLAFKKAGFGRYSFPLAVLTAMVFDVFGLHNGGSGGGIKPYPLSEGMLPHHIAFYFTLLLLNMVVDRVLNNRSVLFSKPTNSRDIDASDHVPDKTPEFKQ